MPILLQPFPPADEVQVHRFSVAEYDEMIRDGRIEGKPVELLDGLIVDKMPHNAPHDSAISRLQRRLTKLLGDGFLVRVQSTVELDASMPDPDVAVVPGPEDAFDHARPRAADLLLVIEVADSSLRQDRGFKQRLYARNRIPIYWVVDLRGRSVTVYTQPRGGRTPGYRASDDYAPGDAVPVVIGKKAVGTIPVSEILP